MNAFDGTGLALEAAGPAKFDSTILAARSGLVRIASPAKTATVTGVSLTASSLVLATVQNSTGVSVQAAIPNISGSSFQIVLNKAPGTGKTAKVAWFVVN